MTAALADVEDWILKNNGGTAILVDRHDILTPDCARAYCLHNDSRGFCQARFSTALGLLGGEMRIGRARLWVIGAALVCLLLAALPATSMASALKDPTADTLDRCLNDPANGSTADQTECEAAATSDYDRRMNAAYTTLLHKLPRQAAQQLRLSQRAWLAFRDSDAKARDALYETRQGTMYVPMQASDATNAIRDRALELEGYVRVMAIEDVQ